MRPSTWLPAISLLLPLARAAVPVPFAAQYRQADAVVIAKIAQTKYGSSQHTPRTSSQASQDCELTLQVSKVLKSSDKTHLTPAAAFVVAYGVPGARTCSLSSFGMDVPTGKDALWLLRGDQDSLRVVGNGAPAVFAFHRELSPIEEHDAARWPRPEMRLAYLFVTPGIVVPAEKYSSSTLPIQMVDLLGWPDFLAVFKRAFDGSAKFERDQMTLVAASFNQCVATAHRVLSGAMPSQQSIPAEPSSETSRREEDTLLRWMSWSNRAELLRALKSPDAAKSELTRWACSSFPRIKVRARSLLAEYFAIDGSSLPCLPCD